MIQHNQDRSEANDIMIINDLTTLDEQVLTAVAKQHAQNLETSRLNELYHATERQARQAHDNDKPVQNYLAQAYADELKQELIQRQQPFTTYNTL